MDASMLTIDSAFAGLPSAHLVKTQPPDASKNTKQTFQTTTESVNQANAPIQTPDNNTPKVQNSVTGKPFQTLLSMTAQKSDSEKPQIPGVSNETVEQIPSPNVALPLNIVLQCLAQQSQSTEQVQQVTAELTDPESKETPATLLADPKIENLATVTKPILQSAENITLKPDENSIPGTVNTNLIESKNISPNEAKQPVVADILFNKAENSNEIQISNKGGEVLIQKPVIEPYVKITAPAEQTETVNAEGTSNTKATSDGQKTTLLNIEPLPVQNNLLQSQDKAAPRSETSYPVTEKSASVEKPTPDEPASLQPTKPDVQEFSESLYGGNKNEKQNSSDNPAILKTNTTELSSEQGKNQNIKSDNDNTSNQIFERPISSNNIQNNTVGESSRFNEAANNSNDIPPGDTAERISRQISESIQNSLNQQAGKQQITVQLNPPELGRVCIKFNQEQNQLTGTLEVERAQTKSEIEQSLPQIIRNLGDAGIQLKRIDVTLTDQTDQHLIKDQSPQNDSFQQHTFAGKDDSHNQSTTGTNEWFVNDSSYEDNPETPVQFTNSTINVLV